MFNSKAGMTSSGCKSSVCQATGKCIPRWNESCLKGFRFDSSTSLTLPEFHEIITNNRLTSGKCWNSGRLRGFWPLIWSRSSSQRLPSFTHSAAFVMVSLMKKLKSLSIVVLEEVRMEHCRRDGSSKKSSLLRTSISCYQRFFSQTLEQKTIDTFDEIFRKLSTLHHVVAVTTCFQGNDLLSIVDRFEVMGFGYADKTRSLWDNLGQCYS